MIYCPSCSTPWRGRGKFCGACGTPIDVEAAEETEVLHAPPTPPTYADPPETFRFGAPPPDPGMTIPIPMPVDETEEPAVEREPIALLQYWPVIVPGIIALISGLLILVQLIK